MLTKSRVVQLLFMLTVLLVLFFWKTFEKIPDKQVVESDPQISQVRCDYKDACEYITDQGTFFLSIENLPIKAEEWIDFELLMPNDNMKVSKAKIVGKDMFMGRIPVTFKQSKTDLFRAKTLVGACTTPEMIWSLEITVDIAEAQEVITFDFMVKR